MQTMMYNIQDFLRIKFNGFEFKLPDETLSIISEIAQQVGSPSYIKTPTFNKKEYNNKTPIIEDNNYDVTTTNYKKKKRINKNHEKDEDWENLRLYQTTKIEEKVGIDSKIDLIRSSLNKMSDKNYNEQSTNIENILDELIKDETSEEDMLKVGNTIFELASNNRFYSKLYADLYTKLIDKFEIIKNIFQESLDKFLELFKIIEHCEPDEDYDRFCKINKENEKRRALSMFFVNLSNNGVIEKEKIIDLTHYLINKIMLLIEENNKKNEVDEITENIAILYNKYIFDNCEESMNSKNITEIINKLSHCKVKTYPSLSNKSIFKYMDMIDM